MKATNHVLASNADMPSVHWPEAAKITPPDGPKPENGVPIRVMTGNPGILAPALFAGGDPPRVAWTGRDILAKLGLRSG